MAFGKVQMVTKRKLAKLSISTKGPCTLLMTIVADMVETTQVNNQKAILEDL